MQIAHLTQKQRYSISVLLRNGKKQSEIAVVIGKDKSVISREIKRNKDLRNGVYKYEQAQRKYISIQKLKQKHKAFTCSVKAHVNSLIEEDYSPEQIVGVSKNENIECVSHKRIYQYIWQDKKEGGELYTHLRRKGRKYRKRGNKKNSRGLIKNRISIDKRPKIVEKRERFGDL